MSNYLRFSTANCGVKNSFRWGVVYSFTLLICESGLVHAGTIKCNKLTMASSSPTPCNILKLLDDAGTDRCHKHLVETYKDMKKEDVKITYPFKGQNLALVQAKKVVSGPNRNVEGDRDKRPKKVGLECGNVVVKAKIPLKAESAVQPEQELRSYVARSRLCSQSRN